MVHRHAPDRRRFIAATAAAAGALSGPTAGAADAAPAWVLHGATIHTVDQRDGVASAMLIEGERITAVGDAADILQRAPGGARKVDLTGRTIVPGFIDAHPHMDVAGAAMLQPPWGPLSGIDDILAVVAREVAHL